MFYLFISIHGSLLSSCGTPTVVKVPYLQEVDEKVAQVTDSLANLMAQILF